MADNAPSHLFQSYLLAGERILWTGRPRQGIALRPMDALLIPFSLLWGGFALFWNAAVWLMPSSGGEPDLFFRLFGLPFLIAGIYITVGRFFHDAAIRKNIIYAVTDQRILVLRGTRSSKFSCLDLRRLPRLEMNEHRDGTGTIAFESGSPFAFMGFSRHLGWDWWVPSLAASSQLFRIADPRKVYQLIRDNSARS